MDTLGKMVYFMNNVLMLDTLIHNECSELIITADLMEWGRGTVTKLLGPSSGTASHPVHLVVWGQKGDQMPGW